MPSSTLSAVSRAADVPAAIEDRAAGRAIEAEQSAKRRRFARAVGAEQGDPFAFGDVEAHVPERAELAVIDGEM